MNAQKILVALPLSRCDPATNKAPWHSRSPPEVVTKRYFLVSAAIVAAELAIWPARTETGFEAARPSFTLELGAGSTVMLERPFKSVLIGNPDVVDVQTRNERSVRLRPLSLGTTNLIFIDDQGIVITNVTILVRNARTI
ncbi:MAG: pilus assembly protein N-terminal domain-containing protein [Xanthobacteraceae bacterium]